MYRRRWEQAIEHNVLFFIIIVALVLAAGDTFLWVCSHAAIDCGLKDRHAVRWRRKYLE